MVGMNEVLAAAADHFLRPIAQYGLAARADLNQSPSRIQHHDQILRGLEDAAKLFGLPTQHLPGLVGFGDVAHNTRDADGRSRGRLDRRDAERDFDPPATFSQADRFTVFDAFAPADPAQRVLQLRQSILGYQQRDVLARGFRRAVSEQPLRRRIPAGDGAVERRRDDGVVGGFDRRAEQPLPLGMMVACRYGAAMLLYLLLERRGLCIDFLERIRKCASEHTGLAACIDRNGDLLATGHPLHGFGQLHDRAGQRPRDHQGQHRRAQHGDPANEKGSISDARGRRHDDRVRGGFDDANPFDARQNSGRQRYSARLCGLIRHDIRAALRGPGLRRQMREVGFPVVRLAEQRAELARPIWVNEIVALLVDDVYGLARQHRRPDTVERAPHVNIDHEKAERFAVVSKDRRRDAKRRPVHRLDQSVASTQIERRDVDLRGAQPHRFVEIAAIVSLQQALFGHDPNRVVRSRAIDADKLTAIVVKADDPKHRIGWLGFEFGREA